MFHNQSTTAVKQLLNMPTYKITLNNKRYNTKNFFSYEDARRYVRRLITKLQGCYHDSYTQFGFKVERV